MIKFTFPDGTTKICKDTDGHMTIEIFPIPDNYDGFFSFTLFAENIWNIVKKAEERRYKEDPTYEEGIANCIKSLSLQNNPQENK